MPAILSIDPSIRNIGWAVYSRLPAKPWHSFSQLFNGYWDYGLFRPDPLSLYDSIKAFIQELQEVHGHYITKLVIEVPQFYDSEKGRIAARNNYLTDLAVVVGYYMGGLGLPQAQVFAYTAPQWKGSLDKQKIIKKFIRDFRDQDGMVELIAARQRDDTIEAIMMLRYHLEQEYGKR